MHLRGAGVAHHLHDLHRGRAAHDRSRRPARCACRSTTARLALCFSRTPSWRIVLRRLDEGAPDIVVADDAELEGDAATPARSRSPPARRNPAPARRRRRRPAPRARARAPMRLAHVVDRAAADDRSPAARNRCTRRCRAAARMRRKRLVRVRCRRRRTPPPRRSRRRARSRAPMMSSAQVSEARIGRPSSSPSTSGRMPSGSRAPISFLLVSATQRIGALELAQRVDEAVDEAVARRGATRCRITSVSEVDCKIAPSRTSCSAQRQAVGEVAVVGDREAAAVELGEQRLDVAQDRLAGRSNSGRGRWRESPGSRSITSRRGEVVADEAHAALGVEALAVEGDDAGRLLAAMLQRVQAERGDRGGVGMAEDAEHAALLVQPVVVEVDAAGRACDGLALERRWRRHRSSLQPCRSSGMRVRAFVGARRALVRASAPQAAERLAGRGRPAASLRSLPASVRLRAACKMVLSGSSGSIGMQPVAGPLQHQPRLGVLRPSRAGCGPGTSQAKNRKATTTMTRPRASPNRKPSVRSSAPIRRSRIMSEIRTVMIETISSVHEEHAADRAPPSATMLVR